MRFSRPPGWDQHPDNAHLTANIRKGGRFPALDYSEFASNATHLRQLERTDENGFAETIIELDGRIAASVALSVQDKIWKHMGTHAHLRPARLGMISDANGTRSSHSLALAQLLIARRVCLVENELLGLDTAAVA